MNYARVTTIGSLAEYDSVDYYKIQVQSNGKLSISLRGTQGDEEEKVLDLSEYEEKLNELKKLTDPEGWAKEQEEKKAAEANQKLLELTAKGFQLQVYTVKNGKEVLVGDSEAEKGSKTYEAMKEILSGDYRAKKAPITSRFPVTIPLTARRRCLMRYRLCRATATNMTML